MKLTGVTVFAEYLVGKIQILKHQDELEIQRVALKSAHGHGHAADEGVAEVLRIEITYYKRYYFEEVHDCGWHGGGGDFGF